MSSSLSIVLVQGGFVDGSGWQDVYNILKKDGYNVSVVQNPTTSLADDVAFTKRVVSAQPGKDASWKTKPSWYMVATDDKMIPPDAQRGMSKRAGATVVEVPGSHAVYVSQPKAVASFIPKAAQTVRCNSKWLNWNCDRRGLLG